MWRMALFRTSQKLDVFGQNITKIKIFIIHNSLLILSFHTFFKSFNFSAQVNVVKDNRIDERIQNKAQKQLLGYRVQICFDSDKALVDQMRAKFISQYPKIDTYITFDAPNFNLKVGDFRTQIEAEKLKEKIVADYSITIIHKELINLPRVD